MKYMTRFSLTALLLIGLSAEATVDDLMKTYQQKGAGAFSARAGEAAWAKERRTEDKMEYRSCASCHNSDPTQPGQHVKTGKTIKPMAVSANPDRYSDRKKVEKWFRRNCRWTFGRDCTAQEKGDFLKYFMSR